MITIKLPVYHNYGEPVHIVVISDLHIGHINHSRKHLTKFLKDAEEYQNWHLIGLGDHMECVVPSDFKRWHTSEVVRPPDDYEGGILDWQEDQLVEVLEPYKDKLIGLGMGNHEYQILRRHEHDPHASVCHKLNCTNLGYSCLLRLDLRRRSGDSYGGVSSVVFYMHHGWGGNSRTEGGNVTKYSHTLKTYWADVYVFGHTHDQFTRKIPRLSIDQKGKLHHRDAVLVNSGTFKKTLTDDTVPSWEEKMGFPPRALGGVTIELTPQRRGRPKIEVF